MCGCVAPLRPVTSPLPVVTEIPIPTKLHLKYLGPESPQPLEKIEWAITLDDDLRINNPFDPNEIDLWVKFEQEIGEPIQVPAYWDGKEVGWRARLMVPLSGSGYATAFATIDGQHLRSKKILVNASVAYYGIPLTGWVQMHSESPRYLAVRDSLGHAGTFIPIGLNLSWATSQENTLRDYERWFDALKANGGNTARIWMSSWAFGLEWNDTGLGDYTKRLDRARLLDRVFEMAEARGIYLILVLLNHGAFSRDTNPEWNDNPYNAANGGPCAAPTDFVSNAKAREYFKRRLRYIAARWAYSRNLLAWEWWNEADLTRIETVAMKPWLQEMSKTLAQYDPNHHLRTISYAGDGDPTIWGMPEIDLLQRHEYNVGDPKWFKPSNDINALQRIPKKINKPFLIGEFGYSGDGEYGTPAGQLGIHFHNSLWASVMNGYAGTAMYWWWDTLVEPANLWPHYKGVSKFLAHFDLATTVPLTSSIDNPFAIAMARKTNAGAAMWVRNGGYSQTLAQSRYNITKSTGERFEFVVPPLKDITVSLKGLPDGRYRVHWIDTLTGETTREESVASTQGQLNLMIPLLSQDIAAFATLER